MGKSTRFYANGLLSKLRLNKLAAYWLFSMLAPSRCDSMLPAHRGAQAAKLEFGGCLQQFGDVCFSVQIGSRSGHLPPMKGEAEKFVFMRFYAF